MPDDLRRSLRGLGEDLAAARKVRRMTQADLAERLDVSRMTVARMERGDHRVSFGAFASAAWVMELEKDLLQAFDPRKDPVFQREARLNLPGRVSQAKGAGPPGDEPSETLDF